MIKDHSIKRVNQKDKRLMRNNNFDLSRPNPQFHSIDFNIPTEIDEELDDAKFKESLSKATCKVSEIKSILYGG